MNDTQNYQSGFADKVSQLVRVRRTTKVLATNDSQIRHPHDKTQRLNALVLEAIADAGFAPFHYERKVDGLAEPWRFHVIWQNDCRFIASRIGDWFPDIKPTNKLPAMLNACGAVVLVNWIPQFDANVADKKKIQINEEHLAATAAAIQNFLLLLTANNLKTYWSSGGFFRSDQMFEKLSIDRAEKLMGAIFVDYGAEADEVEQIAGKNRGLRSNYEAWTRQISLGG